MKLSNLFKRKPIVVVRASSKQQREAQARSAKMHQLLANEVKTFGGLHLETPAERAGV